MTRFLAARARRHPALAVSLFFLGLFVLTAQGTVQIIDGIHVLAVTRSLVERLELDVPPELTGSVPGAGGRHYSKYGIALSILAAPFYAAGKAASALTGFRTGYEEEFLVSMLNPILSAGTMGLLVWVGLLAGATRRAAVTAALCCGLGTMVWPYSETFFSEPATAFFVTLASQRLLLWEGNGARGPGLMGCGAAVALAILCRTAAGIVLPVLTIYAGWVMWDRKLPWTRVAIETLRGLAPLLLGLACLVLYNHARFGHALATGYSGEGFTTPFLTGLMGLTVAPGSGIFTFNPPVLAALAGWFWLARKRPAVALLVFGLLLSHLLLYSSWWSWKGGRSWGPRFLLPTVPLLMIGATECLTRPRWRRTLLALTAIGLAINLAAVTVSYQRADLWREAQGLELDPYALDRSHAVAAQLASVAAVSRNLGELDTWRRRAREQSSGKLARNLGDDTGPASAADHLRSAVGLNWPNMWFAYMLLFNVPLALIASALCGVLAVLGLGAWLVVQACRDGPSDDSRPDVPAAAAGIA